MCVVVMIDYLMYGRIYIPTGKLDALYTTRISPTLQALVAAISDTPGRGMQKSNVMLSLQHDVGRTCTEYSWSAEDGMWGVRVLHNFGKIGGSAPEEEVGVREKKAKRIDEEEGMEGGLKGRISAGAELYFSAKEKSAGGKATYFLCCSAC
jgi:mitochondrial distribution and morphology protein 10